MRIICIIAVSLSCFIGRLHAQVILLPDLQHAVSIDATLTNLFIIEQGKHRMLKLDLDGELIDSLGSLGTGDYQFDTPVDIEASNGLRLYISDTGNNRIQIYDRRFQYLSRVEASEGQRRFQPQELVSTLFGEVLFYEARSGGIKIFDENGQERPRFILPSEIESIDEIKLTERRLYVLDKKQNVIHELEPNGRYRGFFPAKGVTAFNVMNDELIVAKEGVVSTVDESSIFATNIPNTIQDLVFIDSKGIYILTSTQLLKISL